MNSLFLGLLPFCLYFNLTDIFLVLSVCMILFLKGRWKDPDWRGRVFVESLLYTKNQARFIYIVSLNYNNNFLRKVVLYERGDWDWQRWSNLCKVRQCKGQHFYKTQICLTPGQYFLLDLTLWGFQVERDILCYNHSYIHSRACFILNCGLCKQIMRFHRCIVAWLNSIAKSYVIDLVLKFYIYIQNDLFLSYSRCNEPFKKFLIFCIYR